MDNSQPIDSRYEYLRRHFGRPGDDEAALQRVQEWSRPNAPHMLYADTIAQYGLDSEKARIFKDRYRQDPEFLWRANVIERMIRAGQSTKRVIMETVDTDAVSLFRSDTPPASAK